MNSRRKSFSPNLVNLYGEDGKIQLTCPEEVRATPDESLRVQNLSNGVPVKNYKLIWIPVKAFLEKNHVDNVQTICT